MSISVVFMGTPEFAVPPLNALYEAEGIEIEAVVTQPDRPKGRGKRLSFSPVKQCAIEMGLSILQPENAGDKAFIERINGIKPDFLVVAAYGQILKKGLLAAPGIMPVNIHASLLPKYRGAAPIQWAILNGDPASGITIMEMDEGMDTGPIILQQGLAIGEYETFGSLYKRLSFLGAELIVRALKDIISGKLRPAPQPNVDITYAPPIKKSMLKIDWNVNAQKIANQIRAFDPSPGAWTHLKSCGQKRIRLFNPIVCQYESLSFNFTTEEFENAACGCVLSVTDGVIHIKCNNDTIIGIQEIQMEGKRRMWVKEFIRGKGIVKGDIFQ